MAQRLCRVLQRGVLHEFEQVRLLRTHQNSDQHAEIQKSDGTKGVVLDFVLEQIGEGDQRKGKWADIVQCHKGGKSTTQKGSVIPKKEKHNIRNHENEIANPYIDLMAIKDQKPQRDKVYGKYESHHLNDMHGGILSY
jgi:hypothetical protein